MPPSRTPALGSQAIHVPSTSQIVQVTSSTCHNISVFKELMREHRKIDDTVTMRLNRNQALFRDRERSGASNAPAQDEACAYFWSQLVAGWKARTQIIQYCVDVVDSGLDEKKAVFEKENDTSLSDNELRRKREGLLYADEVKKKQLHNELTVEQIVRRRSIKAFQARCKYFEPPLTDAEARKWWDAAVPGR